MSVGITRNRWCNLCERNEGAMITDHVECPHDGERLSRGDLKQHDLVCPRCGYHHRLTSRERIRLLTDPGSFHELEYPGPPGDPLGFVDTRPYPERLRAAQLASGEAEAALCGVATINGQSIVLMVMDFGFIGGSMGSAVGQIFFQAVQLAIAERVPLVSVAASGGARMQEGCLSLLQMAKTSMALTRLREAGLPYLSVLTDPTYGGVTASFASLGDILIAEPGARIGFAGKDIVAATTRRELPSDFQSAEFQLNSGMLDLVVPRHQLRNRISELLTYYAHTAHGQGQSEAGLPSEQGSSPEWLLPTDPWQVVTASRNPRRPTTQDYIDRIFDSFDPLHGDHLFGDDKAIIGGLARLGEVSCMVIGTQRGSTPRENHERNYGMPHPEGYRKALRLMRHAARFRLPIITFVDTLGAHPGEEAERRGQAQAIAQNLFEMSQLHVPTLAVLTGQGGSGGALALALADRVLMLENAYYSVITPESCSLILFKSLAAADRMARSLKLTAGDLLQFGVVDQLLPEPPGGAQADFDAIAATVRQAIVQHLRELLPIAPEALLDQRFDRYTQLSAGEDGIPLTVRQPSELRGANARLVSASVQL